MCGDADKRGRDAIWERAGVEKKAEIEIIGLAR
jgi:hypothetical protein